MKRLLITFSVSLLFLGSCLEEQTNPLVNGETCTDGIQNQNEAGIDCGGVCIMCEEEVPLDVIAPCQSSLSDNVITLNGWYDIPFGNADYYFTEETDYFKAVIWTDDIEFTVEIYETTLPKIATKYPVTTAGSPQRGHASIKFVDYYYNYNSTDGEVYLSYSNGAWVLEMCDVELRDYPDGYDLSGRIICTW